jgi:hypothetical protein
MEFAPKFNALDVRQFRKGRDWDLQIAGDTSSAIRQLAESQGIVGRPLPSVDMYDLRSPEGSLLRQMYMQDEDILLRNDARSIDRQQNRKSRFYRTLADEIQAKKDFQVIPRLMDYIASGALGERRSIAGSVMQLGVTALYLSLCEPDRFLVGVKDKAAVRKKIWIPDEKPQYGTNIVPTAYVYMDLLDKIGRREVEIAPEMPFHPNNSQRIVFPDFEKPIEQSLEEAYFNPRYIVDPEGSEVRFRRAGDLTRMILMESGNTLLAKIVTSYGDAAAFINLEDASFGGVDRGYTKNPANFNPRFAKLVADTYKDLVTAEEVTKLGRGLKAPGSDIFIPWSKGVVEQPQVIYIPRKHIVNQTKVPPNGDDRVPYTGPPRMRPHRVTSHKRRANMTDKHKDVLYEFERKHGLKKGRIVDNLPAGYTFVRAHFSPAESGEYVQFYPIYIKRRIGEEIARQLQDLEINL